MNTSNTSNSSNDQPNAQSNKIKRLDRKILMLIEDNVEMVLSKYTKELDKKFDRIERILSPRISNPQAIPEPNPEPTDLASLNTKLDKVIKRLEAIESMKFEITISYKGTNND